MDDHVGQCVFQSLVLIPDIVLHLEASFLLYRSEDAATDKLIEELNWAKLQKRQTGADGYYLQVH